MVSSCVVLGVHLSIMNMAAFGIVDVFEVGAGSHDPRCNISVGALSAPASARLREFLGDLPDESPPPIVHTKMETQPVLVGQCSAGTQTTVEGGFVGKHATNYMQQVHTNARLSVFYAGCFKNRIAQARMNDTFELAASTLQVPVSKLPSSRTITEQIEAIAALAMAIKGVRLIERGCMDEFFTLILDAGSMRAGKKFQAAVASFYDEGASSEFTTFVLGSIPLACGTDEHRMQRTFEIFEDLVLAVQH